MSGLCITGLSVDVVTGDTTVTFRHDTDDVLTPADLPRQLLDAFDAYADQNRWAAAYRRKDAGRHVKHHVDCACAGCIERRYRQDCLRRMTAADDLADGRDDA